MNFSFQIIPSITLDSGTGIRLKGMCDALLQLGNECSIQGFSKTQAKNPEFVFASKALPNSCISALSRRSAKTKAILDFDDLEWSYWENNWFMKNSMLASERLFVKKFDYYTVHTIPLKNYLMKEYNIPEERILFFGQGIDYKMFSKAKPDKNSKKIIYAAHLGTAAKDITEIFKVFSKVNASFPDWRLEVIGDGMFRKDFEKKAAELSENIVFAGYVRHEKIPEKFSQSALAVNYMADSLANKYRSSIKVREYLAAGLPTVCNEIGDVSLFSEYIESFPTGNFKAFEKTLSKVISNPRNSKALKGKEFVRKNLDWKVVAKKFLKELEAVP
jgi:glycosyltransferase involved in cell wall biosynthesis